MTCVVCVDESEAVKNEQRTPEQGPVTLEELKNYLHKAAIIDWNAEDHNNEVGLQSMELHIEQLTEGGNEELATKIAEKLMFITGINKMGTFLIPATFTGNVMDPFKLAGPYCKDEVVQAITEVIGH